MLKKKFKSFAKINLFLNVGKKFNKTGLHNVQSLVCLINLFDEIKIYKSKSKKDKIKFIGKFSDNVSLRKNTITDTLSLLRKRGIVDLNTKYNILGGITQAEIISSCLILIGIIGTYILYKRYKNNSKIKPV